MITKAIPKLPELPPPHEGFGRGFQAELHRCVVLLHESAQGRAKWFDTIRDFEVTSSLNRRRHGALGRFSGIRSGLPFPWRFNVSANGNSWWPSPSRAIAAEPGASGGRGNLGAIYEPVVAGVAFDQITAESPQSLALGARTFWLRVTLSEELLYLDSDTFQPGIPAASIEVVNMALGDIPPESPTSIYVPWVDVPPAAPPEDREPSYHFALWFRFSHYWHIPPGPHDGSTSRSSSSSSPSSGSSSSPSSQSSSSPSSKSIVL